jgi:hypothetical protein
VHEMRLRGIRVDQSATEQARDYCLQKCDAALAELSEKLGRPTGMKEIASRNWLVQTFDTHKISYPRTAKGNPSFTGGQLGWMRTHLHWLPQLIAKADKYNNAATNFLQSVLDHLVNERVHAEIHPHRGESHGTKSGHATMGRPIVPVASAAVAAVVAGAVVAVWLLFDCQLQQFGGSSAVWLARGAPICSAPRTTSHIFRSIRCAGRGTSHPRWAKTSATPIASFQSRMQRGPYV